MAFPVAPAQQNSSACSEFKVWLQKDCSYTWCYTTRDYLVWRWREILILQDCRHKCIFFMCNVCVTSTKRKPVLTHVTETSSFCADLLVSQRCKIEFPAPPKIFEFWSETTKGAAIISSLSRTCILLFVINICQLVNYAQFFLLSLLLFSYP